MQLKLYLISQGQNVDYDSYDSAVVIAESTEEARNMDPGNGKPMKKEDWSNTWSAWCRTPQEVSVDYLGKAKEGSEKGSVCSSFNAG